MYLTNSFLEEFDYMFHPFLKQQGSSLLMAVTQEPVVGLAKYIRQSSVGEAHYITSGSVTEYTDITYDKRKLEPKAFACPIILDDIDMIQQGTPDTGMLAADAANSCGKIVDQIIIKGLGGVSYSAIHGDIALPGIEKVTTDVTDYDKTQTIAWNDCTLGGNVENNPKASRAGLSASKVSKAVQKLRAKFNVGPLVCVASEYAMSTLRADERVSKTDFNTQPSLASGLNTPYGGCDAFIPCQLVDSGKSKVSNTNTFDNAASMDVEYAYIYALNQIKLGVSKPIDLKFGLNAERYLNNTLIYWGMYDCTRMFEEAVVRIEIRKTPTDDNTKFRD